MTTYRQSTQRPAEPIDAPGVNRPVSPGILAMALLLALAASVASAGVIDTTDPARLDRREAPRELTVRWLTDAVARAARDLAATEIQANAARVPTHTPAFVTLADPAPRPRRDHLIPIGAPAEGWSDQGLINLPPPAQR